MIDQNTDLVYYSRLDKKYWLYHPEIEDDSGFDKPQAWVQQLAIQDDDTLRETEICGFIPRATFFSGDFVAINPVAKKELNFVLKEHLMKMLQESADQVLLREFLKIL